MFDVASVGHFAIDSIFLPVRNKPFVVLGGSIAYASVAASRLEANVSVVSKVGSDFSDVYENWLRQQGVDLSGLVKVDNVETTHFELEYNKELSSRKLQLKNKAPPITANDLPESLKANIIHIAPIANEIPYDVVEKLRGCANLLSLDPQGLVRKFDTKGKVAKCLLTDTRILRLIEIYKSTSSEIKAATGLPTLKSAVKAIHDYGVQIVIVTLGVKGALLSYEETFHKIPVYKPEKLVDPTGAGDVFIGGFLAEYVHGKSIFWCACVGSAFASLIVEDVGPTFTDENAEIYRRAHVLHEKEIK